MKTPAVFTKSGNKATASVKLDKTVFDVVPEQHDLLKQAYTSYLANGRDNLAFTKTRGLVRGGGRKPWRQKGTGRARFGSIRNPIWTGGGIAFGPTGQENYKKKIHKNAKHQALRQALSISLDSGKLHVIESIDPKMAKTKEAVAFIDKLKLTGKIMIVVKDKTELLSRATRNIKTVSCVQAQYLNVYDVLNADNIIIEKPALETIEKWLGVTK